MVTSEQKQVEGQLMSPEPRTVHFETALQVLPIGGTSLDGDFAADLYQRLRSPAGDAFQNLRRSPDIALFTESGNSDQSFRRCEIDSESIAIIERRARSTVDEFCNLVEQIVTASNEVLEDGLPRVLLQRCTIQCLCQLTNSSNALILLAARAANVIDKIGPFGRPPSFFGLRFRFAPADAEDLEAFEGVDAAADKNNFLTLRFETYEHDPNFVWMQVECLKMAGDEDNGPELIDFLKQTIREAYEFLTTNGVAFLNEFDTALEDEEGDEDETE